jgi:hypothetical protein
MRVRAESAMAGGGVLPPAVLAEVQAALAAGASPSAAIAAVGSAPELSDVARQVRLGRPLLDVVADTTTGSAAGDLLCQALAVAERAGAGGTEAVQQAVVAAEEQAATARLLQVRTAQARGTARVLAAIPLVAWVLFVGLDGSALGFYGTPLGIGTALLAAGLAAGGRAWTRRIVASAAQAGRRADPLTPPRPSPDWRAGVAAGAPFAIVLGAGIGWQVGLVVGAAAAAVGAVLMAGRDAGASSVRAPSADSHAGTCEAVELLAVALASGLAVGPAVALIAPLAPSNARPALATAARRLVDGFGVEASFAGTGLDDTGAVLGATARWGAPAAPALQRHAADLRARRRAAAEEAAERAQLALVFPTTLLTLPAFVLAVVPPIVWRAVTG